MVMLTVNQLATLHGVNRNSLLVWLGQAGIKPTCQQAEAPHANLYDEAAAMLVADFLTQKRQQKVDAAANKHGGLTDANKRKDRPAGDSVGGGAG